MLWKRRQPHLCDAKWLEWCSFQNPLINAQVTKVKIKPVLILHKTLRIEVLARFEEMIEINTVCKRVIDFIITGKKNVTPGGVRRDIMVFHLFLATSPQWHPQLAFIVPSLWFVSKPWSDCERFPDPFVNCLDLVLRIVGSYTWYSDHRILNPRQL